MMRISLIMPKNEFIKKIFITIAGTILVIVGLIGWLLPVVPGFFLIVIGLPMMLVLTPWGEKVRKLINKYLHPKTNPR
jgi:uncharacterized protein YqgC (DUF456 family)